MLNVNLTDSDDAHQDSQRPTKTDLSLAVGGSFAVGAGSRQVCFVCRFYGVHAVRLSPFAVRRLQFAVCSMQFAVCSLLRAVCRVQSVQSAVCRLPFALGSFPIS